MHIKSFFVAAFTSTCILAGCTDLTRENFEKNKLKPESFFDFNTTSQMKIDLDYGEYGAYTQVSIYADEPGFSEESLENNSPLFKVFTDKHGKVLSAFNMPEAVQDSVYLYTSAIGTPRIVKAAVKESTIQYKYERIQYSKEAAKTRVIDWPYFDDHEGLHAVLNWWQGYEHGKIGDHNGLIIDPCVIGADALPSITKAFWNGSSTRPFIVDNSASLTDDEIDIYTTKDSVKVYFTFLTENANSLNAIGYYFYPIGKRPWESGGVEKFLIFPNTSVAGNIPYVNYYIKGFYGEDNAPVSNMTTVQLLYVSYDQNGGRTISEYFPKDLAIGFFVIKDSWDPGNYNSKYNFSSDKFIYTDCIWNKYSSPKFIRKDAAGYAVYGAEYGNDGSFDDIMFTMSSLPEDGISYTAEKIPDVPVIPDPYYPDPDDPDDPDEPDEPETDEDEYVSRNVIYRTYCYEDLWPVKGDYDMNDVVIDHCSTIKSDIYNNVMEIVDEFTVCNRYMSAQVADAFAVIIPESQRGEMTLPRDAVEEDGTGAVILFDDVQEHLGKTVKIVRDFSGKRLSSGSVITDLDPFIIPLIDNDDFLYDHRREVHMPKKEGTKKLNASLLGMAQDAYFVDKDGKHPFAITIPLSAKKGEYIIPEEMHQIDSEYADFEEWVESSGKNNKDWYKYYRYAK